MLWKSTRKNDSVLTFIGEGSEIEGKYTFTGTGTIMLNGKLQGEITTTAALIVGEKAVVNATIRAGSAVIWGEVVGDVHAGERVELKGTARVFGTLEAPVIVLDDGVFFEGHCRMIAVRSEDSTQDSSVVPLRR